MEKLMKKLTSLLLCLFLMAALAVPVLATAQQEATEPEEEFYDGLETAYVIWETVPPEMIESGEIYYWYPGEDGTCTIPIDGDSVVQWNAAEDSTLTFGATPDGEYYSYAEPIEGNVQFDAVLGVPEQATIAEQRGGTPALWLVLLLGVSVVLLGLAVLVFFAAVLIVLIVSLVKKKKNKKAVQKEEQ
jgi:hypothetical protein